MSTVPSGKPELADMKDEELLSAYREGHTDVFRTLIERYRQELFNFLVRFLGNRAAAEDIFQETFLQVHISADTFDVEKRFKPWLFTIAANKGRDFMRKRARRPAVPLDAPVGADGDRGQSFVDLLKDDLALPDENMEKSELEDRVKGAVEELPDHLREILLLAYFQKFAYADIADVLEIPLGTVKSRLHTAVGTFAKLWKKMNPKETDT